MASENDSEYPSIRKALLGNDHAANLYCAIKYAIWQGSYLLLALLLLPWRGIKFVGSKLGLDRAGSGVEGRLRSKRMSKATTYATIALLACYLTFAVGAAVWMLMTDTVLFLIGLVGVIVMIGVLYVIAELAWRYRDEISSTRQSAKQKPVFRRIYGYCPVSLDIEPKWFGKLFDD